MAAAYGFDGPNSVRGKIVLYNLQTGSGAHPVVINRVVNRPRREADHSPPSSAKFKTNGAIPSQLSCVFVVYL
jgi:hypothetical protein